MRWKVAVHWVFFSAILTAAPAGPVPLEGAWEAEVYRLAGGLEHPVRGLIQFHEGHWSVLFFVLGDDGAARRASAEGGTYQADSSRVEFTHLYNFSQGEQLPGLAESPLRKEIHDRDEAPKEPCRFEIVDGRLTLHFPSGNSMRFQRASKTP